MNLHDWLSYLETLHPKTIELGLERVAEVKQRLNLNPSFPIITVGGTNGKGSVCAMLESILHAAGYKVGCYTSPHLLHYNERVRINKQQASDEELCVAFEQVERARISRTRDCEVRSLTPALSRGERVCELLPPSGEGWDEGRSDEILLTYFEFGTLAAMQLFVEKQIDVAILEVGLGGRLDAVNVFDADCMVVTSVDMDHMDYLGDTREQIAYEKAGIMRSGKVAVFGDPDMPGMIASEAQRIGAELRCIGRDFCFQAQTGQWDFHGVHENRTALPFPALRGAYQLNNASSVLAALDALQQRLPVNMEAVRRGLVEVQLAGRFQCVPGKPQLILDVAHNPHAARALAGNLAALPPSRHRYAVFAMLKDKDIAGVASMLAGQFDTWLVAGIAAPRGATAQELVQALQQGGVRGEVHRFANIAEALAYAYKAAGENDRIAAFGSFYTVAAVMAARGLRVG